MKKVLTGIACAAAIAAAAVVLLPVAAVKIAMRLSKTRDDARADRPHAETEPAPAAFLTQRNGGEEPMGLGSPAKN